MAVSDLLTNYLDTDLSSSDEDIQKEENVLIEPAEQFPVELRELDKNLDELDIIQRPEKQDDVLIHARDMTIFRDIQSTMITIAARIRHFNYHESGLTQLLEPSGDIICIKSNFGCKPPEYDEPKKVNKTTTRGRKKKEKTRKVRAVQGSGKCMNSQITFITKSIHDNKKYQFKIFRNGEIQLPGAKPSLYSDIYDKLMGIINMLNAKLKPVNEPQIELVKFAPSMKNYRFDLIKADTQLIDLFGLSGVLNEEWIDDRVIHWAHDYDDQFIGRDDTLEIKYLSVDYTRQDTRLSVQFSTPLPGRPDKLVRINVFMKGVVKILGSLHDSVTVSVIRYLHKIIFDHPELLIDEEVDETNANNIICDEVNQALFEEMLKLQYPLIFNKIEITEEDELNFQNWLDKYIITP
jgi:hypothetical protein